MKVVKVWAVWCAGCIVMKPIWRDVESENPWLKTEYFDFDEDTLELEKYHVDGNLPVFIFLDKKWKEIERIHGEISRKDLLAKLEILKNK